MNGLAVTDRESVLCSRRQQGNKFRRFSGLQKNSGSIAPSPKRSSHDDQVTGADHGLQ